MGLHRLTRVTMGVPEVAQTVAYYADFGLTHHGGGNLHTLEGGEQLRVRPAPSRRLLELGVGADDPDDLARIATRLTRSGVAVAADGAAVTAIEPVSGFTVRVEVAPRIAREPVPATPYNGPGRIERYGRAPGVVRETAVRPRKLGHCVVGTTGLDATLRFFTEGLGFKVSDHIGDRGAFLRCSDDHHNVLALAAPVNFLHHTSWQVDDVDDVGRGASAMLEGHPDRHVWGLGRHHAGSNFFWYLKDPAGNFSEYYSDMDCIPEDELWTPEVFEGARGLFSWGPPPPPSFLAPDDLGALMTGQHAPSR
ncbi:VOC family protein [Amycolatopsis sp. PS_44_ISF1]|uniref:VOC family protein n=1 Tax=Amycolatopsis sp. PS_44_ISF1 TaxID=2974917 RepID=UPI0028DF50B3|nr:VOC family protein [Amycolatopsis sp. PS_44_ISF1]MDT8913091.1 VOC family protein [Amycolatopsis sp. PS_44_ISF1]